MKRDRTWELLRSMVRGTYDIQELRIQMGNRLVGNFKVKLGIDPGTKEKDLSDKKKQSLLGKLRKEYTRITDGIVKLDPEGDGIISTASELTLIGHYIALLKQEKEQFLTLGKELKQFPIWMNYLKDVKGVGPAMGAVMISEFDIYKADYPSSLWAYGGLDVVTDPKRCTIADGLGRSKKENHLITVKYRDKKGKDATRRSITFNPLLKTKLVGVLGPSFLRTKSHYADIYQNEKHRLENHPKYGLEEKPGHRHAMGIRKMVKIFLIDLYVEWRQLEGLPVSKPYHVAKQGRRDHRINDATLESYCSKTEHSFSVGAGTCLCGAVIKKAG